MSCTPLLHLYDHMPVNARKVDAGEVKRFASSVYSSPAEVVDATTNKSIWRRALALLFYRVDALQSFHAIDEGAGSVRNTNQLPGVRMNRMSSLWSEVSSGAVRNRSRPNQIREREEQVTLMQVNGVGRSQR